MAEAAFNTIAEVQRLRAAGFEQTQAEAITLSIHAGVTGGVATKADIETLRTATKADIDKLGAATKAGIDKLGAATKADVAALDAKIDGVKETLEAKVEKQGEALRREIADGRAEIARGQLGQLRWTVGSVIALGALLTGLITLG